MPRPHVSIGSPHAFATSGDFHILICDVIIALADRRGPLLIPRGGAFLNPTTARTACRLCGELIFSAYVRGLAANARAVWLGAWGVPRIVAVVESERVTVAKSMGLFSAIPHDRVKSSHM